MSLENGTGSIPATMLVGPANVGAGMPYPVYAQGGNGGMGNGFGDSGWWIVLLFILLAGNNGFGNNWGGNAGGYAGAPVIVNDGVNGGSVQRGFDQAAVMGGINGVTAGISGIQQSLCNGFAGVNATINSTANTAEVAANARQTSNMQQMFDLQSQFANCCCENRLGIADLKYTIATENCADRAAFSEGIRDVITNQNANTQRILDQLCQDKIDAKNDEIAQLRQEVLFARGQASQIAQNEQIVNSIYNRLDTCPVGTTPVYGRTPIFTCNNGCGCGCNGNF